MHSRRALAGAPPPFVLAASRAQSWVEVLRVYAACNELLRGVYQPTTAELHHGLARMPQTWSTALFYYGVIKAPGAPATPDKTLVAAALKHFRAHGGTGAFRRVIEEDVSGATVEGAKAKLALASSFGLWEAALEVLHRHPSLATSAPQRRLVLASLAGQRQWRLALAVLFMQPRVELSPLMVRPLVRCLGRLDDHRRALQLTAACLAAGHTMTPSLFTALLPTLQRTGQWVLALQTAQEMNLLSVTKAEARQQYMTYVELVNCLYGADFYGDFTLDELVQDTIWRTQIRAQQTTRPLARARQVRMRAPVEVFQQSQSMLMALSSIFNKAYNVPRWYSRSISAIVETAMAERSMLLVLDTNFLLNLVQKQLPLEHFHAFMTQLYPDLRQYAAATVVVPFTTVAETHAFIWGSREHLPLEVRRQLWQRVETVFEQPRFYVLSIACEYPCSALAIVPRLAYKTMPGNVAGAYRSDPDLRILSVCAALQHYCRVQTVAANAVGPHVPEGVALFSLLKYHVRRYCNSVKGCCIDRLVLCTMDKRMARGAAQMGLRVFPALSG